MIPRQPLANAEKLACWFAVVGVSCRIREIARSLKLAEALANSSRRAHFTKRHAKDVDWVALLLNTGIVL